MPHGVPYGYVALVAVIWLAGRHVWSADASDRSKRLVGGLTVASVLTPWLWPATAIPAALLQVAICIYLLLRDVALSAGGRLVGASRPQFRPRTNSSAESDGADH